MCVRCAFAVKKNMKQKILVMQLSRYGDILMTLPLLEQLSEKYEVYLMYNILFKDIPSLNSDKFSTIPIDFNQYYSYFNSKTLVDNIIIFKELIEEINKTGFDIILNLSSQPISAVFTSLLKASKKFGIYIMYDGTMGISGKNMSFYFEMNEAKKYNHIHQMDFYKTAIDDNIVKYNKYISLKKYADNNIFSKYNIIIESDDKIVAVQPSASISKKEFDINNLKNFLCEFLDKHKKIKVIILGSKSEINKNKIFKHKNIYNLTGKTDIVSLISILNKIDLLITNDTGTMHFAGSLEKKIILLSSGSAFYYETAVYNEKAFIIPPFDCDCYPCVPEYQCSYNKCKTVSVNIIKDLMYLVLFNKPIQNNNRNIYKPVFLNDDYIYYFPQSKTKLNKFSYAGWLYHNLWKSFFYNKKFDYNQVNSILNDYYIIDENIINEVNNCLNHYISLYIQSYDLLKSVNETNIQIKLKQFYTILGYMIEYEQQNEILMPLKKYREVRFHSVNSTDVMFIIKEYTHFFHSWKKIFIQS